MRQAGSFFKSFLPFIFFMAANAIVSIIMMIVFTVRATTAGTMDTDMISYLDTIPSNTEYIQATSIIFAIIIIIIFTAWYRTVFVRPLRSKPRKYWSGISFQIIIALIFLGFGLQYVAQLIVNIIEFVMPELMANYNQLLTDAGYDSMSWVLMLYSLILAPICEELTFRGLTMRFARKSLPFWAANIFQAILFGVMHLNVVQGIYAFALGLFLGWVCQKGHSIKYSIMLHIIFNILGTIFIDFFDLTLGFNAYAFYGVGIVLTVFAMLIYYFEFSDKNKRRREKYEEEIVEE